MISDALLAPYVLDNYAHAYHSETAASHISKTPRLHNKLVILAQKKFAFVILHPQNLNCVAIVSVS